MLSLVHVSIREDAPRLVSWARLYNKTSILFHHYGLYRHCSLPNRVEIDREQACAMCSCPLPLGLPLLIGPQGLYSEYRPPHSYLGAPVTYNVPSVSSTNSQDESQSGNGEGCVFPNISSHLRWFFINALGTIASLRTWANLLNPVIPWWAWLLVFGLLRVMPSL